MVDLTKLTRGEGSWKRDRQFDQLAGVFRGWAFVCAAMAISTFLES